MVWSKKAAAPATANEANTLRALVAGTPDDWIVPWLDLLPAGRVVDVEAFCELGPPPASDIGPLDFLAFATGGRLGAAIGAVALQDKLTKWMLERLFGSWCESSETVAGTCDIVDMMWAGAGVEDYAKIGPGNTDWVHFPAGATWVSPQYGSPTAITNATMHFANESKSSISQVGWVGAGSGYQVNIPAGKTWLALTANYGVTSRPLRVTVDCVVPVAYVPPVTEQPDTAIPPTPGTYATIADLGARLDSIQNKLHWVLDYTTGQLATTINPLVADTITDVVADDEDIAIDPESIGVIVTVSNIGNQTDERFGEPRMLHRLGRVVLGNGDAWLPPVELTVSPMILLKPDPTITKCRVQVYPPATATVTSLVRAPLLG